MTTFRPDITVHDQFCIENRPDPTGMVIFGASGDLTARKLLPSIFDLFRRRMLSRKFFVIGCGRTEMSDNTFRDHVRQSLKTYVKDIDSHHDSLELFLKLCHYKAGSYRDPDFYLALRTRVEHLSDRHHTGNNTLFYFSLPPSLYGEVAGQLSRSGLVAESKGWARVIIEKPFGRDLSSAMDLDRMLHRALEEHQIYRIDHYLGKETVQNIMMFRFANSIFEPLFNRRYIDNVQITVAESIGVGNRAGYFEQAGMIRDMFQNHMMQMLALVAMEPPATFNADAVRDEKVKVLRAIEPYDPAKIDEQVIRGQYQAGEVDGEPIKGYHQEEGVAKDSMTDTFVATRLMVNNWRWQGVPFYLRTGKRLGRRLSEIAITFKPVPHSMFAPLRPEDLGANQFVLNVQPDDGISLRMLAKRPGPKLCMSSLDMSFKYCEVFEEQPIDAYARLLLDAMLGDQTLFVRSDEMLEAWRLLTPVLNHWEAQGTAVNLPSYAPGSWGPKESCSLVGDDCRVWRDLNV